MLEVSEMTIPEHFLDKEFFEVRQKNVDEFFAARGVPWLIRKLIVGKMKNGRFHLTKNGDKYHIKLGDPSKNIEYDFEYGQKFKGIGYDGKEHEITFCMDGHRFKEIRLNLSRPEKGEDVFYYEMRDGILHSECSVNAEKNPVTWKREFEQKK